MPTHKVQFADGKTVTVNTQDSYLDLTIDALINRLDGTTVGKEGIKVIATSILSFYQIKDLNKASASGLEAKLNADMMTRFILEEGIFNSNKPPYIIATVVHGGAHYQALLIHVKEDNRIDVTVINSINKIAKVGLSQARQEALEELSILNELKLKIDNFTYKENFIQPGSVDCGPTAIRNLQHELEHYGQPTQAKDLAPEQSIIIRAQQAYELQYSKAAPQITAIDGKPTKPDQTAPVLSHFNQQKEEKHSAASLKRLTSDDVINNLCETLSNISARQAHEIYNLSENFKARTPEEHFEFLVQEYYESNEDVEKLINRLRENNARKNKQPRV